MTHKIRSFAEDTYHEVPEPTAAQRDAALFGVLLGNIGQRRASRLHGLMYGEPNEQDGYDKEYGSASEADFALFCLLGLGTQDGEQLERIARTSTRYREKGGKHK